MEREDIVRALLYKFFSKTFMSPKKELLVFLEEIEKDLKELDYGRYTDINVSEIIKALRNANDEKIATEYVSLFINKYPKVPCPPHESYFRSESLYDPLVISDLNSFYSKMGLEPKSSFGDHISNIFEYMFVLILSENMPEEEKTKIERDFFLKHIASWVKKLTKCIKENTKEDYYKAVAKHLETFIKEEKERLK